MFVAQWLVVNEGARKQPKLKPGGLGGIGIESLALDSCFFAAITGLATGSTMGLAVVATSFDGARGRGRQSLVMKLQLRFRIRSGIFTVENRSVSCSLSESELLSESSTSGGMLSLELTLASKQPKSKLEGGRI